MLISTEANAKPALDPVLPGHLGDIMSYKETTAVLDGDYSPLERIVLTANGNLQRILSSYFNTKVTVGIVRNALVQDPLNPDMLKFDREVDIHCLGKLCCNAKSDITVSDAKYIDLIVNKGIGIGQLFRYMNILPEFELLSVCRESDFLIRNYVLESHGIRCIIKESFPNDLFHLIPSSPPDLTHSSSDQSETNQLHLVNSLPPHSI
ncbi:hypothetical protein BSLG_002024 [Batrachochytrium salamandrivorans]|nr:hypothetical protein BASA62_005136 [Batrachochytrium salamandrivorans]KAH9248245.1 hypothetical protein BASA81_014127 [Batrachochytrium salamandrivorans]KAH9270204.1 hypothetical protein BASA83_007725 [Batrachochytrium salamandrivorans]KAJ1343435.1 hypothetical protein BSLG_002024 [Batrachochytrium salamandrivorans]